MSLRMLKEMGTLLSQQFEAGLTEILSARITPSFQGTVLVILSTIL